MTETFVAAPYGFEERMDAQIDPRENFVYVRYAHDLKGKVEVAEMRGHDGAVLAQMRFLSIPEGMKMNIKGDGASMRAYFYKKNKSFVEMRFKQTENQTQIADYSYRDVDNQWIDQASLVNETEESRAALNEKIAQALRDPAMFLQNGNAKTKSPYIVDASSFKFQQT